MKLPKIILCLLLVGIGIAALSSLNRDAEEKLCTGPDSHLLYPIDYVGPDQFLTIGIFDVTKPLHCAEFWDIEEEKMVVVLDQLGHIVQIDSIQDYLYPGTRQEVERAIKAHPLIVKE